MVNKRLSAGFVGGALLLLSAAASAQCENMVVVVRNSVYPINGLDAFCKEFNQMKADLASMKSALAAARQENAMLREGLAGAQEMSIGPNLNGSIYRPGNVYQVFLDPPFAGFCQNEPFRLEAA